MIIIKIDGREVKVQKGMNLIAAAESVGIHIPNLCYLKGMKGIGACRMCLIEIEGMKAPVTACTMQVKEGMSILTNTERVREVRKFVIDLIVSMHPLDCMTCTKAGICNLQKYAYEFEIKESSFSRKKLGFNIDDANPLIKLDPDYCILCSKCIRVCKHQGTNVLEFKGRGVGSKIIAGGDQALHESDCTFCGSCVDVCPVNAILEADRWRRGREWDYEKVKSVCLLCGNSCDITVSTIGGGIAKINAGAAEGLSERYICAYGRFGFDCIEAETRVISPMKRVDGVLVETTWEDAVKLVAEKLMAAGEDTGFISTGGILNEDALALRKFAMDVVKTRNVDSTVNLYADEESMSSGNADLESADLIMIAGLNPSQWERILPATDAVVRKRVSDGAKLVVINSRNTRLSSLATMNFGDDEVSVLASIAKALISKGFKGNKSLEDAVKGSQVSEEIEKAAILYAQAKNPVILSSPSLYAAAANITLMKGVALAVPIESNAKGVMRMGLNAEGKTYGEMVRGGMKVLYAIGEVPLTEKPIVDFLVVQNSHLSELAKQADIVLPSAAYLEVSGTLVDYLGRLKHVRKAVNPAGASRSHREILGDMAREMGAEIGKAKESEIKKLAKVDARLHVRPFEKKAWLDVSPEIIELINGSVIKGSRLLWLREIERTVKPEAEVHN
ncbi:MAG: molybdopterin-dependent oxidoreductase [Nitrospirae bacterium]|nr:molybdopterin-dependent oxidoreductase [Nitrospirota bacterium]